MNKQQTMHNYKRAKFAREKVENEIEHRRGLEQRGTVYDRTLLTIIDLADCRIARFGEEEGTFYYQGGLFALIMSLYRNGAHLKDYKKTQKLLLACQRGTYNTIERRRRSTR